MITAIFASLAVIDLEIDATQVKEDYFYKSGPTTMSIYFKCASKHPSVHDYMPSRFHRKFYSSSINSFGDGHDTSLKKLFVSTFFFKVYVVNNHLYIRNYVKFH